MANTRFNFISKTKHQAITVDIDSTLADTSLRAEQMIDKDNREDTDWLAYAQACGDDPPTDVVPLVRALHPYYTIVLVTSRPVGARNATMEWLDQQEIPFDALVMDEGYHSSPTEFKVAAVQQVSDTYDVLLHIDDWWAVARAIKVTLDIPTVVVRVYAPSAIEPAF